MTSANPLPITCPHCRADEVLFVLTSATVLTVQCATCKRTWSLDTRFLPRETLELLLEYRRVS